MQKFTQEQALVLTGYTGILCCSNFGDFQLEVDKRLGYPTWTHQYADKEFVAKVKELFKEEFLSMIPECKDL